MMKLAVFAVLLASAAGNLEKLFGEILGEEIVNFHFSPVQPFPGSSGRFPEVERSLEERTPPRVNSPTSFLSSGSAATFAELPSSETIWVIQ